MLKAAIYHFTDVSQKRPKIYMKQLKDLEEYAVSLGFTIIEIFCDKSLLRCEHPEFDRFLSSCEIFDALIVKDFYHISKTTTKCMNVLKELRNKCINVHTLENGSFTWDEAPFNETLHVATYTCRFGIPNEIKPILSVQNDILSLYSNQKTKWTITDQYFDESEHQLDGKQIQLMKLIENKDKYDLILVHNLKDIHWRTANFCKIREQLQLDIYALQDGFLKYTKKEESI